VRFASPRGHVRACITGTLTHPTPPHPQPTHNTIKTGSDGCVNAVAFSDDGELLATGGDDGWVFLYQTDGPGPRRKPLFSAETGHQGNIFNVRFLGSGGRLVASCSADGSVRVTDVERGTTRVVHQHMGSAKKVLAVPGEPRLLRTCGEDGTVCEVDLRERPPVAYVIAAPRAGREPLQINAIASARCACA
jgi:WD40 repeat protein